MDLLAGIGFGLAAWFYFAAHIPRESPLEKGKKAKKKAKPKKVNPAFYLVPVSHKALLAYKVSAAALFFIMWIRFTGSAFAAGALALLGWQMPMFIVEIIAGVRATTLDSQKSLFLGGFVDALSGGAGTITDAVRQATYDVVDAPLGPRLARMRREIAGSRSPAAALGDLAKSLGDPFFGFFAQTIGEMDGKSGVPNTEAFEMMDVALQKSLQLTAEMRATNGMYMLVLAGFWSAAVGLIPFFWKVFPAEYMAVRQVSVWPDADALAILMGFSGLRHYTKAKITVGIFKDKPAEPTIRNTDKARNIKEAVG